MHGAMIKILSFESHCFHITYWLILRSVMILMTELRLIIAKVKQFLQRFIQS